MTEHVSPAPKFKVEVRDRLLNLVGEIADYSNLELRLRLNDVSTWSLSIPRDHRLAAELSAEGAGIVVRIDGQSEAILSGYWTESSEDNDLLEVSGEDDTATLSRRLAYPDPTDIVPPYTTAGENIRTGLAANIMRDFVNANMGPTADITRRIYQLSVDAPPAIGPTLTYSGRWQNLLVLCQEIAAASEARGVPIRFYITQIGGALGFFIEEIEDVSDTVWFSRDMGNLASFKYQRTAPKSNYAIVGGDGEGTARAFYEKPDSASIALWGRIEGELTDSRNSGDTNEMSISADQYLAENGATKSLSITPIDTTDQQYGIHYHLGSKVKVLFDPLGPKIETVTGVGTAVADSVELDKVTIATGDSAPFADGTRVRIKRADGTDREFGVRVVMGQTVNGSNIDVQFSPALTSVALEDDYLEAFTTGYSNSPGELTDIVREVNISVTDGGTRVSPAIGTSGTKLGSSRIYRLARTLRRRMVNLERR